MRPVANQIKPQGRVSRTDRTIDHRTGQITLATVYENGAITVEETTIEDAKTSQEASAKAKHRQRRTRTRA